MTGSGSSNSPPPELVEAVNGEVSCEFDLLPEGGCHELLDLGGDYTWAFRIYRTTYNKPNSDANFARAIDILKDYTRLECFNYCEGDRDLEYVDGKANRQLWQRLKHEIIQDLDLLASKSPAELLKLHQDWVHSHAGAKVTDHSKHRYFLVVDDEVINHLLQLPMPGEYEQSIPAAYSVKLYDAWSKPSSEFYGRMPDPEEDAGMCRDEELEAYEGWFWMSAHNLASLWFCEDNAAVEELFTHDNSWGGQWRAVHIGTSLD